jgi:hypothetical protein
MGTKTIWCPVLQIHVTCITDLEDRVVRVICYEYEEATGTCRMKREVTKGGPLSQLVSRVSCSSVTPRTLGCAIA